MGVGHTAGVLPGVESVTDDFIHPDTVFYLGKDEGAVAAHFEGVAFHYFQVGTDGRGEIGLISSVTEPFCKDCHRARLSADGKIYTCLFTALGWDVLGALRAGTDDEGLRAYVARVWAGRLDRYSDERAALLARGELRAKVEMSYIGG